MLIHQVLGFVKCFFKKFYNMLRIGGAWGIYIDIKWRCNSVVVFERGHENGHIRADFQGQGVA